MDDVEFNLVPASNIRGSSVNVLGGHVHDYSASRLDACFAMCAATADCDGFVDHKPLSVCSYKRFGAKVTKFNDENSDVYIRVRSRSIPEPPSSTPSPPPLPPAIPLTESGHRIFLVPGFISPREASALRKFAARCFRVAGLPDDLQRRSVGAAGCLANRSAVLLSRIEERISRLTGLPPHEDEETLVLSQMPIHSHWFDNLHHDKNKVDARVAVCAARSQACCLATAPRPAVSRPLPCLLSRHRSQACCLATAPRPAVSPPLPGLLPRHRASERPLFASRVCADRAHISEHPNGRTRGAHDLPGASSCRRAPGVRSSLFLRDRRA